MSAVFIDNETEALFGNLPETDPGLDPSGIVESRDAFRSLKGLFTGTFVNKVYPEIRYKGVVKTELLRILMIGAKFEDGSRVQVPTIIEDDEVFSDFPIVRDSGFMIVSLNIGGMMMRRCDSFYNCGLTDRQPENDWDATNGFLVPVTEELFAPREPVQA